MFDATLPPNLPIAVPAFALVASAVLLIITVFKWDWFGEVHMARAIRKPATLKRLRMAMILVAAAMCVLSTTLLISALRSVAT